jgi:hypothetical protein
LRNNLPKRFTPTSGTPSSRRLRAAALATPDLAALIFSASCSGIRGDFHSPACVITAKSNRREMLRFAYKRGLLPGHEAGRHTDPLRHPFEDRRG